MPIEVGIWRMGERPQRVDFSAIETEKRLEDVLASDLSILEPNLLLIGRQVPTAYGKFIDLLAVDREGNVVVIELKKDKTPREVVAQVLDYGSWVRTLEDDDIAGIFEAYTQKYYPEHAGTSLDQAFCEKFGVAEMPDSLNEAHELLVVAAQLDDSTERIINYLIEFGVAVNAVFFRFFKDGNGEYLSRAWLIEPDQAEAKIVEKRERLPWNGEYYVSFGGDTNRDWEEALKYGFISAGGGTWYTKSLGMLEKGARVWVNMPKIGYVGVGTVVEGAVPIDSFLVDDFESLDDVANEVGEFVDRDAQAQEARFRLIEPLAPECDGIPGDQEGPCGPSGRPAACGAEFQDRQAFGGVVERAAVRVDLPHAGVLNADILFEQGDLGANPLDLGRHANAFVDAVCGPSACVDDGQMRQRTDPDDGRLKGLAPAFGQSDRRSVLRIEHQPPPDIRELSTPRRVLSDADGQAFGYGLGGVAIGDDIIDAAVEQL